MGGPNITKLKGIENGNVDLSPSGGSHEKVIAAGRTSRPLVKTGIKVQSHRSVMPDIGAELTDPGRQPVSHESASAGGGRIVAPENNRPKATGVDGPAGKNGSSPAHATSGGINGDLAAAAQPTGGADFEIFSKRQNGNCPGGLN